MKENKNYEVYPPGTRFWVMTNNRPTEIIVRSYTIVTTLFADDCRLDYTLHVYNPENSQGLGSYYGNSAMKDPLFTTREKLIVSLF